MNLEWSPRVGPLAVEGCWVEGEAAERLRDKLLAGPRPGLRAAWEGSSLVLLGADLPWAEGVVYLGREGNLYLPTLWQPNLPVAWIVARLEQLGRPPWALLPPHRVIGLSQAAVMR